LLLWRFTLQLLTGKAREANSDLQEEAAKKVLPPVEYHELRAMAAAALGDYATADKHLELADKALALPPDEQLVEGQKKPTGQMLEVMVATAGWLAGQDGAAGPTARLTISELKRFDIAKELTHQAGERVHLFELRLMRGLLALEAGNTTEAATHLRASLRALPNVVPHPEQPIAKRYQEILEGK